MLKPTDFKYKIRTKDDKIYSVAVRYSPKMTKVLGMKAYTYTLREDETGIYWGVGTITGAEDITQALIWIQYKEFEK